jgi:hypothetical protein
MVSKTQIQVTFFLAAIQICKTYIIHVQKYQDIFTRKVNYNAKLKS